MLCLLAKVDSEALAFDASTSKSNGSNEDQDSIITVVVLEGLEVRLPMAGQAFGSCYFSLTYSHSNNSLQVFQLVLGTY